MFSFKVNEAQETNSFGMEFAFFCFNEKLNIFY